MAKLQADLDTLQRVRVVLATAMDRDLDAAEALDRAGLLLHPARASQITANVLFEAAELIDQSTVKQLSGPDRMPSSPVDTKVRVVAWLRREAQKFKDAAK